MMHIISLVHDCDAHCYNKEYDDNKLINMTNLVTYVSYTHKFRPCSNYDNVITVSSSTSMVIAVSLLHQTQPLQHI